MTKKFIPYEAEHPFACRFKTLLGDGKGKQKELAVELDVTQQTISNYCNGKFPPIPNLIKIARHFNVSTDFLLGLTATPSTDDDIKAVTKALNISAESAENLRLLCSGESIYNSIKLSEAFDRLIAHKNFEALLIYFSWYIYAVKESDADNSLSHDLNKYGFHKDLALWKMERIFQSIAEDLREETLKSQSLEPDPKNK